MKSKIKKFVLASVTIIFALTFWANFEVNQTVEKYIFDNINEVKSNNVGLLLGTSKITKKGFDNAYFFNRIDATVELFKAGKIKKVIISGDNSRKDYNEPEDMKMELVRNGIPDSLIYLDFAGFRTLDAVIRARDIFGQTSFTIISQKFHNQRATYLARKYGINAFAYNAREVNAYFGIKTKIREFFARDKMFFDLIFGVQPKFSGTKINID